MQKYDYFLAPEQLTSDTDLIIRNVGFSQCPPNYTYGWDTRDYYLIHYCLSGHGIYYAFDREYRIGPGDGFLILPGSTIKHLSDPRDPWNLCWVGFRGDRIPDYLQKAGLDQENGGELADHLSSLYDYMIRRLLLANLRNDSQAIEEVEGLLGNIAEAWKQISPKASSQESR